MKLRILKPLPAPHSECKPGSVVIIHGRYGRKLIARGLVEIAIDDQPAEVEDDETTDTELSDEVREIIFAIRGLDTSDDSLFFKDGRPKVKVLEEILDWKTTEEQRNQAFAELGL